MGTLVCEFDVHVHDAPPPPSGLTLAWQCHSWFTIVSIHWNGPLDWTTGLTFDPKVLTRNGDFVLTGSCCHVMPLLWSGRH